MVGTCSLRTRSIIIRGSWVVAGRKYFSKGPDRRDPGALGEVMLCGRCKIFTVAGPTVPPVPLTTCAYCSRAIPIPSTAIGTPSLCGFQNGKRSCLVVSYTFVRAQRCFCIISDTKTRFKNRIRITPPPLLRHTVVPVQRTRIRVCVCVWSSLSDDDDDDDGIAYVSFKFHVLTHTHTNTQQHGT